MKKQVLISFILLCMVFLNFAAIRKNEDPILNTQAEGVLYKQRMEEEKDGVKGPLLYHVRNNPSDTFFIDPPFAKDTPKEAGYENSNSTIGQKDVSSWWDEPSDNVLDNEKSEDYTSEQAVEETANDSPDDDDWW